MDAFGSQPKAVYCKTLNRTFPSLSAAQSGVGAKIIRIKAVLDGASKSVKGHQFEWFDPDKHPAPTRD